MIVKRNLLTKVSIIAIAALMIGAFVVTVPMSTDASYSQSGSGTVGDPYIINTIEELQAMNDNLSAHYKLGTIIYFEDELFTPIGNASNPFTGSFEGDGFWILNLTIQSTEDSVGLFGHTGPDATIMNVSLQMVTVTGQNSVGGLVGHNYGDISQCMVSGTVSGYVYVGGLVGANDGLIINSYSIADVEGDDIVGGLVGWNNGGEINRTYAAGLVDANTNKGGLVGLNAVGTVNASYFDNQTTNLTVSDGGYGKTTEQMKNQTTFVDWDFEEGGVWRINEGVSYPRLQKIVTLEDIEEIIQDILDEVCNSAGVILFIGGVAIVSSRKKKS